jgi:hypothetical protein
MNVTKIAQAGFLILISALLLADISFAQGTYKNGKTLFNTGTMSVKGFQNYGTSTAGVLKNSGTINVTNNGSFTNGDNSSLAGTVLNYYTNGWGQLNVTGSYTNNNGSTVNDSGTASLGVAALIKVGANLSNGTGSFSTSIGTVEYNGSARQLALSTTYGGLKYSGTDSLVLGTSGTTTVNTLVGVYNAAGYMYAGNGTVLDILTPTIADATGHLKTDLTSNVKYDFAGTQDVFPSTGVAGYGTLTLGGSAVKTVKGGGSVTVSSAFVNPSGTTLTTAGFATASAVNLNTGGNDGTIAASGTVNFNGTPTIAGTFAYSGASQAVQIANYNNLSLTDAAGAYTFAAGTFGVAGNYSITAGTGSRSYNSATIMSYNGNGLPQTVAADAYTLLAFSGTATKTLSGTGISALAPNVNTDAITIASGTTVDIGNAVATTFSIATGRLTNGGTLNINGANGSTFAIGTGIDGAIVNNNVLSVSSGNGLTVNGTFDNEGTLTNAGNVTVN